MKGQSSRHGGEGSDGSAAREIRLLARDLKKDLEGEVRFDAGSRALYSTDSSNYRQIPIGLVLPRHAADVEAAAAACRRHGVPILPRGGGTSLAGQSCNVAVVIDFSKHMNRILDVDPRRRLARVQPGVILDELQTVTERDGLWFGPDPATHNNCTFGGMIGNNACGTHSVLSEFAGLGARTSDNLAELEVLTYDGLRLRAGPTDEAELRRIIAEGGRRGAIYAGMREIRDRYGDEIRRRFPRILRRVSGYNLDELLPEKGFHVARALAGTEGTCALALEAVVHLVEAPAERVLVVMGFADIGAAGDCVPAVREFRPMAIEGIDDRLVTDMKQKGLFAEFLTLLPKGEGWLIVEFGGPSREEARAAAERMVRALRNGGSPSSFRLVEQEDQQEGVWKMRESSLGVTAHVPGEQDAWEGWEDTAVAPERIGDYLRDFRKLLERFGYDGPMYGHFGQGIIHSRINFGLKTKAGIEKFRSFIAAGADLVLSYGGSLSGEHGDGQSRAEFLPKMFGPELMEAFRRFKGLWDPENRMNPRKVIDPYRIDENLRLGTGYAPPDVETHFRFPQDQGSFSYALQRCVGVGSCRKTEEGTMCPSYMVTREEKHSTRGRSRLLFEMLQNQVIGKQGWKDDSVEEALSLCLSCKACKAECPVNVDMATYKAEFRSHYYKGRLRPRAAYSMGLVYWWARLGSMMPGLANLVVQSRLLGSPAKSLAGISPRRELPRFAKRSFRDEFRARESASGEGPRVILWPDTFNNFFLPETMVAAAEVLQQAGFRVVLPPRILCCGRPLYDFGMLSTAKKLLRQILAVLREDIRAGIPIVGLEPSCVAVFRDELKGLFPMDEDARRLSAQTFLFSEFLERNAASFTLPRLPRPAIVHAHCHHQAILKTADEVAVLERLGLDYRLLDSGCCGLAGPFGFEKENYEVSVKCGERVLLPEVRGAGEKALIISDGFSCREQIRHLTHRRALHLAQVIRFAQRPQEEQPETFPEDAMLREAAGRVSPG